MKQAVLYYPRISDYKDEQKSKNLSSAETLQNNVKSTWKASAQLLCAPIRCTKIIDMNTRNCTKMNFPQTLLHPLNLQIQYKHTNQNHNSEQPKNKNLDDIHTLQPNNKKNQKLIKKHKLGNYLQNHKHVTTIHKTKK
jgi:hypothetical protein